MSKISYINPWKGSTWGEYSYPVESFDKSEILYTAPLGRGCIVKRPRGSGLYLVNGIPVTERACRKPEILNELVEFILDGVTPENPVNQEWLLIRAKETYARVKAQLSK